MGEGSRRSCNRGMKKEKREGKGASNISAPGLVKPYTGGGGEERSNEELVVRTAPLLKKTSKAAYIDRSAS